MSIYYTLNPKQNKELYKIKVKITAGNDIIYPKALEGDIKIQKIAGNKNIVWNIFDDVEELEGEISVEIIADVYLPPNLFGIAVSTGFPGLLNYNMIVGYNKINLEYSSDFKNEWHNSKQLSIGYGYLNRISFNFIIGAINFIGEENYPTLYALDNNIYEYWGFAIKRVSKSPYLKIPISIEMGAINGDPEFYEQIWQGYIQIGTGIKIRF